MKKKIINYSTTLVLIVIFFIVGIIGILIFPGFLKLFGVNLNSLPKVQIYKIHNRLGILLILLLFIHTKLNWKWIVTLSKQFINKKQKNKKSLHNTLNYIISIVLIISYVLLFTTGIIKFPSFLSAIGINLLNVPINEVSLIHDWSGVVAVFLSIVHLILNFNWLKSTTKSLFNPVKSK
jgi:hypothetical protein